MPKIIGRTLADHRELTRQRLFDALSQLMTEQPFDLITMSQIAHRAQVGRTAVYNHFPDKESLLLSLMEHFTAQFANVLQEALAGQENPIEQLRIYIRANLELKEEFHLSSGINLKAQISKENISHLHEHAGIVEHVLFHILEGAMRSKFIPQQNSLALVSLIHSTLAGQLLPKDPTERENSIQIVQAFILRAIGVSADIEPFPDAPSTTDTSIHRHPDALSYLRCPVVRP